MLRCLTIGLLTVFTLVTGVFENASFAGPQGRYPVINATALDTTDLAAVAAWHVLQGFLGGLGELDANITSKDFNLWTERYVNRIFVLGLS